MTRTEGDLDLLLNGLQDLADSSREALSELENVDPTNTQAVRDAARTASNQLRGPESSIYYADECDSLAEEYEGEDMAAEEDE